MPQAYLLNINPMAEIGRPTVMTPETIAKLEAAFLNGASDTQACFVAGIAPATLYNYGTEYPEFLERKEALKEQVKYRAKMNITNAINDGDKQLSQWLLERRDPDYKPKQETDNKGQVTINIVRFEDSNNTSPVPAEDVSTSAPQGA